MYSMEFCSMPIYTVNGGESQGKKQPPLILVITFSFCQNFMYS